jgi:hypothetical protein
VSGFHTASLLQVFQRAFREEIKVASEQESELPVRLSHCSAGSSTEGVTRCSALPRSALLMARIQPDGYKPLPTQELRSLSIAKCFSTGSEMVRDADVCLVV